MTDHKSNAWLLEIDPVDNGVTLLVVGEDGSRRWLHSPFPVTFYAAGSRSALFGLEATLKERSEVARLFRSQGRDLFRSKPVKVLGIETTGPRQQEVLFKEICRSHPDLTYYDADLLVSLRCASAWGVFPLCFCSISASEDGVMNEIIPLETPWDLDPPIPPLRTLSIEPDCSPLHAEPLTLRISYEQKKAVLPLEPARPLLAALASILRQYDPDLLLTGWGDRWLLPHLIELAEEWKMPLPLNRVPWQIVERKAERSYFSYGQVIHRDQQIHLVGRCHIDRYNAMLFHDYEMEGVYELARVTALPLQTAARVSPGSGISAMQVATALRQGILVPWHKQQVEESKSLADFLRSDQGGLVYQPITGLHRDVAEVDFISMYPSIMVHCNISPETVEYTPLAEDGPPPQERGLIPQTLAPLLEKRLKIKRRLALLPAWDPRRKRYKAQASAHKWLLVTCFGYLGYKNARFGRIEAHEAVTAFGREALLHAKETAENCGYEVLHLYVDGLWLRREGSRQPEDFTPLLEEITRATGLPIALDGVYDWIAFLPSRLNEHTPVANRYFGLFQDGSLKARGIESRRRDTAPWVADTQMEMLEQMMKIHDPDRLSEALPLMLSILRRRLSQLRDGLIHTEDLVVTQKLSRNLDEYHSPSPAARAASQLAAAGKKMRPGQMVQFIYTRGEPGVHAWDLPSPPDPASIDLERYRELLLRAASTLFQPIGISEGVLKEYITSGAVQLSLPYG